MPQAQLERFYGSPEAAQIPIYMGYAFRGFNTHGRALFTLAHRAMAGQNEDDYVITDGERICSTAIGWNFGDGHMHNEQLIAAMQERCQFEPGEVRVVLLDAQPIHKQTQAYRLVDAATGEFESGIVRVADMVTRQPWADDVPVQVLSEKRAERNATAKFRPESRRGVTLARKARPRPALPAPRRPCSAATRSPHRRCGSSAHSRD